MTTIQNKLQAGKALITGFGKLIFDNNGLIELEDEVATMLSELKGFDIVTPEAPKSLSPDDNKVNQEDDENSVDDQQANAGGTPELDEETQDSDEVEIPSDVPLDKDYLNTLTVPALKKIAKDKGIDTTDLTKKIPLIDAILA